MTLLALDLSRLPSDPAYTVRPLNSLRIPDVTQFLHERHHYDSLIAEHQEQDAELFQYIPVRAMINRETLDRLLERYGCTSFDLIQDQVIIRYLRQMVLEAYRGRVWDEGRLLTSSPICVSPLNLADSEHSNVDSPSNWHEGEERTRRYRREGETY